MRNKLAVVKNIIHLQSAYQALASRDHGIPGIGLVYGYTGFGKTTAIAWLCNQVNGVYVRALGTWAPGTMLGTIMQELGAEPSYGNNAGMVQHIAQQLAQHNRPLFIDEGDYLLQNPKMIDTVRDLHDVSSAPVVLIGHDGFEKRLVHRKQLARRISQWVEFRAADRADARTLTDTVCEVEIEDDLLDRLHEEANGSMGLMAVGLSRIEALAKANGWKKVDAERWGNRQFFLSRAPKGGN